MIGTMRPPTEDIRSPLRAATVAIALALGLAACGGSGSGSTGSSARSPASTASTSTTTATHTVSSASEPPDQIDNYALKDGDADNDVGAPYDDTNNGVALDFGEAAAPAEARDIGAIVKRYYEIALTGNGARGCAMLYSTLSEAAAEDYAVPGGPEYVRGDKTCAEVLTGIFKHYHARLAAMVPKLRVVRVRVQRDRGYAIISSPPYPDREFSVDREGRVWRIGAFLDNELP